MAGATKTTADAILQEDYQPAVREQLNNDMPLLALAEKKALDTDGRRAVLSLHVGRGQGIGARAEGGTLPTAGAQGWQEERVSVFHNYARGQISGQLLRAADNGSASFTNALRAETEMIVTDLKKDVNRQAWGTGDGVIATAGLTTSSLQVQLATTTSDVQFRQLQVGMPVDVGTIAAPTLKSSNNAIVRSGGAAGTYWVELTAVATSSGTDFLFRTGNGGNTANTSQKEITGVQLMVDSTGTLFNVNPTTVPSWASTEQGNSGTNRAVNENLMIETVHLINIASGEWPDLGAAHHGVQRAFGAHLMSTKRHVNTINLDGGYGTGISLTAGGGKDIPITTDIDCPANSLYFFNTKHLQQYEMSDWEFMNEDGATLARVANADAYEFTLFKYHEFATDKRNSHGKLVDLIHA